MKKCIKKFVITFLSVVMTISCIPATRGLAADTGIVATDHQKYTYTEMVEDIKQLQAAYPDIIHVGSIGTSVQGRDIPVVIIGNPDAEKKILIHASIHAREYITSLFVMKEMEYIASTYYTNNTNDVPYQELFSHVCFHVVPMVNPDGVMISQDGVNGAVLQSTKDWLTQQQASGSHLNQIKANSNGVDLNRNWPTGFGQKGSDAIIRYAPALDFYGGAAPLSEPETKALYAYVNKYSFYAFVNYHTQGNIIFYNAPGNSAENSARATALANVLHGYNRYSLVNENKPDEVPHGTYGDYVQLTFNRPSATVEFGTMNPVPINQFSSIYSKNKESWGGLAFAAYYGQF